MKSILTYNQISIQTRRKARKSYKQSLNLSHKLMETHNQEILISDQMT